MANQYRNWILTINNPEQTDEKFAEYLQTLTHLKYYMFQRERGEEKETEHFQVYIEFEMGKRFDFMKTAFPKAHIEARKGTKKQARAYCMKEDTRVSGPYEYGTFAEERERTDLTDIVAMIEDGATDYEIAEAYPSQFFFNHKHIERVREMFMQKKFGNMRRTNIEVTYIYGSPGVGKTRYVLDKYGDDKVFRMSDYGAQWNNERFDGYGGEDVIIFDEFRSSIKIAHMLQYLDIYPVQLPARYHNKAACFTKVYIVSNDPLYMQYASVQKENPKTWQAFLRRISAVYNFDKSKDTPLPRALWTAVELTKDKTEQLGF